MVGKTISLDNHPFDVLGVIGPGFTGVDVGRQSDIYVPICAEKIVRGENNSLDEGIGGWLRVDRPAEIGSFREPGERTSQDIGRSNLPSNGAAEHKARTAGNLS